MTKKLNSLDTIEAPSTAAIQQRQTAEELFHLERTISGFSRDAQCASDAAADLEKSADTLKDSVDELAKQIETLNGYFEKIGVDAIGENFGKIIDLLKRIDKHL
jgi:methyl-accepting chemotaxis protein